MTLEDAIHRAFDTLGCPGLGVDLLAKDKTIAARLYADQLRRSPIALPDTARAREAAATRSLPFQPIPPVAGIVALASHQFGGAHVGAVRRLLVTTDRPEPQSDFERSCASGELASLRWLHSQLGLFEAPNLTFRLCRFAPLPEASEPEESTGRSAGLAAALAATSFRLGPKSLGDRAVAATGIIDATGAVDRIEHAREKIQALAREAPFVSLVLVPADNYDEVRDLASDRLEIVPVKTVVAALAHVFGSASFENLARLDLLAAAEAAFEYESAKEHRRAHAIAERVLAEISDAALERHNFDALSAEALARPILMVNLVHRGRAKEAIAHLEILRARRAGLSADLDSGVYSRRIEARLAAISASAWIDCLEPANALECCDSALSAIEALDDKEARYAVLGSRARSLTSLDRLDEAEAASDAQLEARLNRNQTRQVPQAHCNRIAILVRRARAGESDAIGRAEAHLAKGRDANQKLVDSDARARNATFLALWAARIAAVQGDAEAALASAPDAPSKPERFPSLHIHRFVAEALYSEDRSDDALTRLDALIANISPNCGPFEDLILHTASARKACILIALGRDGWPAPATTFCTKLQDWTQRFNPIPDLTDAPTVSRFLNEVLDALPY